jgi:three-Cys-motif partner protein
MNIFDGPSHIGFGEPQDWKHPTISIKPKRPATSDGLIARESGEWAEEKLYYLKRYFYAFNQATKPTLTKSKFSRRVYVDLLAGSGRCYLKKNASVEFEGSPLVAMAANPGFTDWCFVEGDAENADALRKRVDRLRPGTGEFVINADANDPETIAQIRSVLHGYGTLGLIFVDTLGLSDVHFSTLQAITRDRRADLIYTFHVQDVTRNLAEALSSPTEAERWTKSFGDSDWGLAWLAHAKGQAGTVTVADALTTFFEQRLQNGLGYPHVTSLHRLMKNSMNAPLYRLILASHDPLAPKLWHKISAVEANGQRGLALV